MAFYLTIAAKVGAAIKIEVIKLEIEDRKIAIIEPAGMALAITVIADGGIIAVIGIVATRTRPKFYFEGR